ncbi:MAG: phosphoenolpyruvate--protein phosphotransferase [Actinomycetota bacterium]
MAKRVLVGAGVGTGVTYGAAFVLARAGQSVSELTTPMARLTLGAMREKLDALAAKLESEATGTSTAAEVLQALAMILRDPLLFDEIKAHMSEGSPAARAVRGAFSTFARQLQALGGYFAERAADLDALADRVIAEIEGVAEPVFPTEPFVLVAEALSPVDAAKLSRDRVLGVITIEGTATSHSAIIARAANLPTVMGVIGAGVIRTGDKLLVDATSGQVFVSPTAEEVEHYRRASIPRHTTPEDWRELNAELPVKLLANLGSSFEGAAAIKAGAQGVGLFRTELLYLGRLQPPSFDSQVFEYIKLLARFQGKRVVARVLDLDFDKPLPFLKESGTGRYANRGLHTLLANRPVLETQLAALAQAARTYPSAELWVMAPMVISADEARQFVEIAHSVGLGVAAADGGIAGSKVGAMIEVPEITEPAELNRLLELVDFVSIGTNDLTNYVLGVDRHQTAAGSVSISDVRDPRVMSLVERVVTAATAAGKPVSVCGEAAADPSSAKQFIAMGVDSLSASPALLPQLRMTLLADAFGF